LIIMNTSFKTLIAALATVAATSAFAQEATPDTWIHEAKSVATRQAVNNEARAARAAGEIAFGEAYGHDFSSKIATRLTRAQVVAEAIEAQRLGLTQTGEVQRFATQGQLDSIRRAGQSVAGSSVASR
jgi:Domain of unknown function (DUF4148)